MHLFKELITVLDAHHYSINDIEAIRLTTRARRLLIEFDNSGFDLAYAYISSLLDFTYEHTTDIGEHPQQVFGIILLRDGCILSRTSNFYGESFELINCGDIVEKSQHFTFLNQKDGIGLHDKIFGGTK